MTHQFDHGKCLSCGEPMTAATDTDGDAKPTPGDVTVCLYCGHLMEFDVNLKLARPSDATIKELAGGPRLLHAMRVVGAYREDK